MLVAYEQMNFEFLSLKESECRCLWSACSAPCIFGGSATDCCPPLPLKDEPGTWVSVLALWDRPSSFQHKFMGFAVCLRVREVTEATSDRLKALAEQARVLNSSIFLDGSRHTFKMPNIALGMSLPLILTRILVIYGEVVEHKSC